MTIDDQLRQFARRADEHQRAITADEIVRRASVEGITSVVEHSRAHIGWWTSTRRRHLNDLHHERRPGRQWALAAAASIGVVALGLLAIDAGRDPDSVRTRTVPPTPAPSTSPATTSPSPTIESSPRTLPATTAADGAPATTSTPPISISPRGGSIAFAADAGAGEALTDPVPFQRIELHPEPMDIYITGEGEPTRRLISTNAHERCPAFSPDGERLAYLELSAQGGPSIVVVRLDAADPLAPEMRVLLPAAEIYETPSSTRLTIGVPCPQWSPDGRRLAYLAYTGWRTGQDAELRVSTLDGQELVVASVRLDGYSQGAVPFAWSPDGNAIAYAAPDGVWRRPLDGSAPSLVWNPEGIPISVSWSSRGEMAVTVRTSIAEGAGMRDVLSVHVVDAAAGGEQTLDTIHVYDFAAAWSPDGSQLAFVGDDGQIRLSDRDDGSTTTLSPRDEDDTEFRYWDVAWAPNGDRLLALARSDLCLNVRTGLHCEGLALFSVSTDGASADLLTPWTWAFDWINLGDVSWQPIRT
jgi:Tol biopolymer transport system component